MPEVRDDFVDYCGCGDPRCRENITRSEAAARGLDAFEVMPSRFVWPEVVRFDTIPPRFRTDISTEPRRPRRVADPIDVPALLVDTDPFGRQLIEPHKKLPREWLSVPYFRIKHIDRGDTIQMSREVVPFGDWSVVSMNGLRVKLYRAAMMPESYQAVRHGAYFFGDSAYREIFCNAPMSRRGLNTNLKGRSAKRRMFGIELEMVSPLSHGNIIRLLERHLPGLNPTSSFEGGPFRTSVKEDGSIDCAGGEMCDCGDIDCPHGPDCTNEDGGEYPVEIATKAMPWGSHSSRTIRALVKLLAEKGCSVNRSCGLHVHVSHPAFADGPKLLQLVQNLGWFWDNYGPAFAYLMPEHRRENSYCRVSFDPTDKYCMIGVQALARYGTVEFRSHPGTLDGSDIMNWVNFCMRLVDWAAQPGLKLTRSKTTSKPGTMTTGGKTLLNLVKAPSSVKKYLLTDIKRRQVKG